MSVRTPHKTYFTEIASLRPAPGGPDKSGAGHIPRGLAGPALGDNPQQTRRWWGIFGERVGPARFSLCSHGAYTTRLEV